MASTRWHGHGPRRDIAPRWTATVGFAARGFVILGMAGVSWLSATAADAAAIERRAAPDDLVPATAPIREEAGETNTETGHRDRERQPEATPPIGGAADITPWCDGTSVHDLARDLTRPPSIDGALTEAIDPGRAGHGNRQPMS